MKQSQWMYKNRCIEEGTLGDPEVVLVVGGREVRPAFIQSEVVNGQLRLVIGESNANATGGDYEAKKVDEQRETENVEAGGAY